MMELIGKMVGTDNRSKIRMLNSTIDEKEASLKRLEKACSEKKHQLDRLVDESIVCRHQLLQKSNFLRKKSDELYKVQEKLEQVKKRITNVGEIEENNKELIRKVSKLEKLINSDSEIQKLRAIIEDRDKSIQHLSKGGVVDAPKEQEDIIQISKDQFGEIEKRLKEYKQRAELLENENIKLASLARLKQESNLLEKVNSSIANVKEVLFFGVFRNNYEKLTKA